MRRFLRGVIFAFVVASAAYLLLGGSLQSTTKGSTEGICRYISWYKAPVPFGGRQWKPTWGGPEGEQSRQWVLMPESEQAQQLALCGKDRPTE